MSSVVDQETLESYYKFLLKLVLQAGQVFRDGYEKVQTDFKVKEAFFDLVTVYDKQIEELLINGIRSEYPDSKFIGEEEMAASKREAVLTDEPTWIIDPIDGTTNFIHKIPQCCISIGLSIKKELVLGIVYNPIANELYSAWKDHGAYLNGQRIHVTKCTELKKAVLGYEISLIHCASVRDKNVKRIYKLASNTTGTRCVGSAALTLCYVARGSFDCYHVEDLKSWDIAAGAIILREAGGVIMHTTGGNFDIMKPDLVAASTNELAQSVIELIEEANGLTQYQLT